MPFDLHLIISENSREAQIIQQVASMEHITQEQATTRLLSEGVKLHGKKTPAEELIGAFQPRGQGDHG